MSQDTLRCCKCNAEIPFNQGIVIGVCTPCWNAAVSTPPDLTRRPRG